MPVDYNMFLEVNIRLWIDGFESSECSSFHCLRACGIVVTFTFCINVAFKKQMVVYQFPFLLYVIVYKNTSIAMSNGWSTDMLTYHLY